MSTYITKRAKDLGLEVKDATEPLEVEVTVSHAVAARGARMLEMKGVPMSNGTSVVRP